MFVGGHSFSKTHRAMFAQGHCKRHSGGQRKSEKSRSTFWDSPDLGSAEGGHPILFRFVPISPFSSDLFRFAFLVFGNTPICSDLFRFAPFSSDLFRFVFRTNQNKSGKPLSADPFCKSPNILGLQQLSRSLIVSRFLRKSLNYAKKL